MDGGYGCVGGVGGGGEVVEVGGGEGKGVWSLGGERVG